MYFAKGMSKMMAFDGLWENYTCMSLNYTFSENSWNAFNLLLLLLLL